MFACLRRSKSALDYKIVVGFFVSLFVGEGFFQIVFVSIFGCLRVLILATKQRGWLFD